MKTRVSQRDDRKALSRRLLEIRIERYGKVGVTSLAATLGLPELTWENYEAGVIIPGHVILQFIEATGANPRWLLTGEGPRFVSPTDFDGKDAA